MPDNAEHFSLEVTFIPCFSYLNPVPVNSGGLKQGLGEEQFSTLPVAHSHDFEQKSILMENKP